jgi:hypothetical protein
MMCMKIHSRKEDLLREKSFRGLDREVSFIPR